MLSLVKYQERMRNLSTLAAKVYEAVPLSEPWSMTAIYAEVTRHGSTGRDSRVVHGCLDSLKEAGLVEEPRRGVFIRAQVRAEKTKPIPSPPPKKQEAKPMTTTMTAAKTPRTPLAILSELSARAKKLTDDIETAALEIDEYMAAKGADSEKLKQLQALLRA